MKTPAFLSVKSADLIDRPEMSERDSAPHFGHLIKEGLIPRDRRSSSLSSVRRLQRSASSPQVIDSDQDDLRVSINSGNQTRCASPDGTSAPPSLKWSTPVLPVMLGGPLLGR